jgi:hypothetical protein
MYHIIFLNKLKNEDLPSFAASVEITDVVLAGDGDSAIFAVLVVRTVDGRRHVTGISMGWLVAGRSGGSNGQESSDDKLN